MSLSNTMIIDLYNNGQSCADIAYLDGCSETAMYHRLKSLDVIMRSRSEANQIFPDFIFIMLYNLGLSASQIGKLLGIDASTVIKRLHILGFPLRSRRMALAIRYTEEEFMSNFMSPQFLQYILDLV